MTWLGDVMHSDSPITIPVMSHCIAILRAFSLESLKSVAKIVWALNNMWVTFNWFQKRSCQNVLEWCSVFQQEYLIMGCIRGMGGAGIGTRCMRVQLSQLLHNHVKNGYPYESADTISGCKFDKSDHGCTVCEWHWLVKEWQKLTMDYSMWC